MAGVPRPLRAAWRPYRLPERLGSGGMGSVHRAERDDQEFRKKVAIKVVSRGMNTDFTELGVSLYEMRPCNDG